MFSAMKSTRKNVLKYYYYLRHWAGRCSWAGVGPERRADPEPWRCIPPSAADPAPGSAAASEDSALDRWTATQGRQEAVWTSYVERYDSLVLNIYRDPDQTEYRATAWRTFLFLFIFVISRNSSNRNTYTSISFAFSGDEPKKDGVRFCSNQSTKHVNCVGVTQAVHTREHQFPFVQQTSVRNEVLQSDSL